MTTRQITPPAALAVSLSAARISARTEGDTLDAELTQKIQDYTADAEHRTGRALITQTWKATLACFPAEIELRPAPLASVAFVKYYDAAGVLETLDPLAYLVDTDSEPGRLLPAPGTCWPATAMRFDAVQVQYVCGYGPDDTAVPASIKGYILGMIENDYFPNPNVQYLTGKLDSAWVPG